MAATLLVAAGCGGSGNGNPSAPAVQRVGAASLAPGGRPLSRPLPPNWAVTMQVRFGAARSALQVSLGSTTVTVFDGSRVWHRVEVTRRGLVVDGRHSGASSLEASTVGLRAVHGRVDVRSLVISRSRR